MVVYDRGGVPSLQASGIRRYPGLQQCRPGSDAHLLIRRVNAAATILWALDTLPLTAGLLQAPPRPALRPMLLLTLLLALRWRLEVATMRWVPDLACHGVICADVPDQRMLRLVLLLVLLVLLVLKLLLLLELLLVLLLLRRRQLLRRVSIRLRRMPRYLLPSA